MIRRTLCRAIPASFAVLALALGPVATVTAAPASDPAVAAGRAAARDGGWLEILARLVGLSSGGAGAVTAPAQRDLTLAPPPASAKTTHDDGGALDPVG